VNEAFFICLMFLSNVLDYVGVDVFDFFGLDAEVSEGYFLVAVSEDVHELGYPYAECDTLVVAEGLAKGMGRVVAPEVQGGAPGLYKPAYRWDYERTPLAGE